MLFGRKKRVLKPLLGIDIGAHSIKLLELAHSQPMVVENYGIEPVQDFSTDSLAEIRNPIVASQALEKIYSLSGLEHPECAISLHGAAVIIKKITIDKNLSHTEIEAQAWLEAKHAFPELIEDLSLDFNIMGPSADDEKKLEVVIVVCRKEHIDVRFEILKDAGLEPKVIDVDYYALQRSLNLIMQNDKIEPNKLVLLLNLGMTNSTLIAMQNGQLIYHHDLGFYGHYIIEQCQTLLNVTTMLTHPIKVPEDKLAEVNNIVKENVLPHIRHFLQFFYSNSSLTDIDHFYISGECALVPGLAQMIEQEIQIKTAIANPFAQMTLAPHINPEQWQYLMPSLVLCCGLALCKEPV